MSLNKIKPKFYVYGCDQLLNDLQELISSAGEYENSGESSDDWLLSFGIKFSDKPSQVQLSWGEAINIVTRHTIRKLASIRDESIRDCPF